MKFLLVIIVVSIFTSVGDQLVYKNCMSQTKSDYITAKGVNHVAAQCKAFILEKIMVKQKKPQQFSPLRFVK